MTNCMIMIMVLAALLTPGGALAQVDQSAMSLRGIPGFVVQVQSTPQLDHRELQAVAELELRRLGIRVLTAEEVPSTPGAAGLLISVALTQAAEAPLAGGMTTIEVLQAASLRRQPDIAGAFVTWRSGGPWIAGVNRIQNVSESSVKSEVALFLNAFRAANLKWTP